MYLHWATTKAITFNRYFLIPGVDWIIKLHLFLLYLVLVLKFCQRFLHKFCHSELVVYLQDEEEDDDADDDDDDEDEDDE